MTTCIKCGRPVADGELFCAQCGLNPGELELDGESRPERHAAPAGRMQKPQRPAPQPAPKKPVSAPVKPRASFRIPFAIV